jgi:phage terminase small subunit
MPILSPQRHERFAQLLALGVLPEKAYAQAGFKPHNSNPYRLSDNERIRNRVSELQRAAAARVERRMAVDLEKITTEFIRMGTSDITDVVSFNNEGVIVRDSDTLSEHVTAAIAEVRQTKDGVVVKMHDKRAALVDLGKHLGYFKENVNLSVTITLADLVNMSYRDDLPAPMKQIEGKVDAGE